LRKLAFAITLTVAVITVIVALGRERFADDTLALHTPRLAAAFGVVEQPEGDLIVHVTVLAPVGVPSSVAIDAALNAQSARFATPADLESANFVTSGLVWDQFSDGVPGNNLVLQNYNPSGEPVNGAAVLLNTHNTWNSVATSSFAFGYGGTTTRCPSLVEECTGAQSFDGFNDVAFMSLAGPCNAFFGCTLGVTWYSTSIDEADMALNTKVRWTHNCVSPGGSTDAESVMLHENGHVLGLGHTDADGAVMEAFYSGANCVLHQDDIDGVSSLYPDDGSPDPTATPTDTPVPPTATNTPDPDASPTIAPTDTPTQTPSCPPGHRRRGIC
jgi:hypothetical protein